MKVICESVDICPKAVGNKHCGIHERGYSCRWACDVYENEGIINTECIDFFLYKMKSVLHDK